MTPSASDLAAPWEEGTAFSPSIADPHLRGVFLAQRTRAPFPSTRLVVHHPNMPLHCTVGAVFGVLVWMFLGHGGFPLLFLLLGMGIMVGCILASPVMRQEEVTATPRSRREALLQDALDRMDRDLLERAALDHVLLPALREGRFPAQDGPWSLDVLWTPLLFPNPRGTSTAIVEMELALCRVVPLADGVDTHNLLPRRFRMIFPFHDLVPGLSLDVWDSLAGDGAAFRLKQGTFAPAASAHARLGLLALFQERHKALKARIDRRAQQRRALAAAAER